MFKGSGILVNFQSFEYFKILLVGGGGMDGKKGRWKLRKRLGVFFMNMIMQVAFCFCLLG